MSDLFGGSFMMYSDSCLAISVNGLSSGRLVRCFPSTNQRELREAKL